MISLLRNRSLKLRRGGITREEAPKIRELDSTIESLREQMTENPQMFSEGSLGDAAKRARFLSTRGGKENPFFEELMRDLLDAQERQNELLAEQLEASRETAGNTNPRNNRNLSGAPAAMRPNRGSQQ